MTNKVKKRKQKRPHWTEYKKIPYEDWKHLKSIIGKDYTKVSA